MEYSWRRKAYRRTLSFALALSMLLSLFPVQGFAAQGEKADYADVGKTAEAEQRETAFLSAEPLESSSETPERADKETEPDDVKAEQTNPSETLLDELASVLDAESGGVETEQTDNGEFTPVEKLRYTVNDGTVILTGCGEDVTNLDIPSTIDGCPVISIEEKAFQNNRNIQRVIIPDTVKTIGISAFQSCTGLTEITMPVSITLNCKWHDAIGGTFPTEWSCPFYGCNNISAVKLTGHGNMPNYWSDKMRKYMPWYYGADVTVEIAEGITDIGAYAFEGCAGLKHIIMPEGITSIGGRAFGACSGLSNVIFPESLTVIGSEAFAQCSNLSGLTLPAGITIIGNRVFESVPALK